MSNSVWPYGQTPLSMGFSRQEYWIGLPCPPPGDLSDPGIELASLPSPSLTGGFFTTTWGVPPHGCVLVAQSCPTLWNPTHCRPPGSSVHGKDTGVDCHALLQGDLPDPGTEPWIPHCRQILHKQVPKEAPHRWVLPNYLCKIHMRSCFPKYKSFN